MWPLKIDLTKRVAEDEFASSARWELLIAQGR